MWLIRTRGFFSVVAHRDDAGSVLVRARARADLETLADLGPTLEIEHTPRADYGWRAPIARPDWEKAAAALAAEIDYATFKNAVVERQRKTRASLYAEIWLTLRDLQRG